jgi:hypothetical protein
MWMLDTIKSALSKVSTANNPSRSFLYRHPSIDFDRDMNFLNEQMRTHAGVSQTRHNIFADNWTGETREMRLAYRKALAEPTVKAALLEKIISVCRLNLQMTPANKRDKRSHEIAQFCQRSIERSEYGVPGVLWGILSGGLIDGWSLGEKLMHRCPRGEYRGLWTLKQIKSKDTRHIQIEIDPFRNITGFYSMRGNSARWFDPKDYVHFSYLSFFENPTGMSDIRAAFRGVELMPAVIKMRAVFLEKFTGPWIKGKISNTALREKMAQELAVARAKGYIVIDKDSDVEIIDMATRGTADFQACIEDLRQEMAIAISGAFLHMMTGNAGDVRGDSQVQQGTVDSFVWWLATLGANSIQRHLVPDLVEPNFGANEDYPTCSLAAVKPGDIVADLQIDKTLNELGLDLDSEELYDRAKRSPPQNKQTLLPGRRNPPPVGPNPFGGNPPDPNQPLPVTESGDLSPERLGN